MSIQYPAREVMETLVCVIDADQLACPEYEFFALIGRDVVPLADDHIQELIRRGWLELVDLPTGELCLNVTPDGNYHGERWFRQYEKARERERRAKILGRAR